MWTATCSACGNAGISAPACGSCPASSSAEPHWHARQTADVLDLGGFDPGAFEDEYREALRALAGTSRALEVNTQVPLHPRIVRWWREAGGDAVTFGNDAHDPAALASGFSDAAAMVQANGFRPCRESATPARPAAAPRARQRRLAGELEQQAGCGIGIDHLVKMLAGQRAHGPAASPGLRCR